MEFFAIVAGVVAFLVILTWRERHVIEHATDTALINELKRRAFRRKMKSEADAEVEATIRQT